MAVFNNILAGASGATGADSGYQIDRSLRFNSGDSAYLSRTPSSAGNRTTWTWSGWVKRTTLGTEGGIFSTYAGAHPNTSLFWESDGLKFHDYTGSYNIRLGTTEKYRDPSAWYHIVLAYDSTESTASDRAKLWINGALQTLSGTTVPSNHQTDWNSATQHDIGKFAAYFDGYLADVHFIDGQALAATDFGEYDDNNVWQPKEYSGTYGTNGFHLDFSDNSSNSALGTDSSGAENNWTVNNLRAESNTQTLPGVAFDGNGDSLSLADSDDWNFGSGDFTVEAWVNQREITNTSAMLINQWGATGTSGTWYLNFTSLTSIVAHFRDDSNLSNAGSPVSLNGTVSANKWHHIAVTRSGNTWRLFVDGQLEQSATSSITIANAPEPLRIGIQGFTSYRNGEPFDGYVSNVRIVKGTAVYTSNFTPSTSLTNVTNTKLLCCQSSSSATAATVGGTITASGDAYAGSFSDSTPENDSLIDTPTSYTATSGNNGGNYATLNPVFGAVTGSTNSPENGNLTVDGGSSANFSPTTIPVTSGKWYVEVTAAGSGNSSTVGVWKMPMTYGTNYYQNENYRYYQQDGKIYNESGATSTTYSTYAAGDVIGIALDMDNGKVFFSKNGTFQGSSVPASGTNPAASGLSGTWAIALQAGASTSHTLHLNAGQRSFSYTPPTGFLSLCTTNLADPTIADGSTAFDTVLYTGDGNSTQNITGLNFAPDLTWQKIRNQAGDHGLTDSVRGVSAGYLQSEDTDAEKGNANNGVSAFNSDGFTVKGSFNTSSNNWVTWAWDAGSSTVSNTDGSITSSVRASQTNGFSIVTWTRSGGSNIATIGHGLNAVPELIILKDRDTASNWYVGSPYIDPSRGDFLSCLNLNTTASRFNNSDIFTQGGDPTSSVFGVGAVGNPSGNNLAYCFAPVEGYSAFGSYTGNGSSDGPFVYTGFRPRWILVKASSSVTYGNWLIHDTERSSYNVSNTNLYANLSNAEDSTYSFDILSNGFKIRSSAYDGHNGNGSTYIYAAFAEHPFKTARAR